MVLGLIGLAVAFNSLWLLLTLVPFAPIHPLRRSRLLGKKGYLERKFGASVLLQVARGLKSCGSRSNGMAMLWST